MMFRKPVDNDSTLASVLMVKLPRLDSRYFLFLFVSTE
jgi:hypothetical protein